MALQQIPKFKLHGLQNVLGNTSSTANRTFYDTYEEAYEQAKKYVSRGSDPAPGIVIFKAIAVVELETPEPPIVVRPVDNDGFIVRLPNQGAL